MQQIPASAGPHPQGEPKNDEIPSQNPGHPPGWPIDTPGGRVYAEWANDAPVTREASLAFFFQFLDFGGRWAALTEKIPLAYESNNASNPKDVIGALFLGVLAGHWRYAHLDSIRGDGVNPGLLGMEHVPSEDAVRRGLARMDEGAALTWLREQNMAAIAPILALSWILDIDNTVKPVYGRQEGAEIGYNPHKPGRPSYNYHSYFVANLRLCLGVEVLPGKRHAAKEGLPGMWAILEKLPRTHWPTLIRGDCAYGNEAILTQCEARGVLYLFKLKQTPNVKRLVQQSLRSGHTWQPTGDGWETLSAEIKLHGWSRTRRCVLMREGPAKAPVAPQARRRKNYHAEQLGTGEGWDPVPTPWSGKIAVLVTNTDAASWADSTHCTLYRGRADAENIFDETKNQWGWGGFTTRRISPTRILAMFIALVYNLWRLYVRYYDEEHNREAVVSRPALMQGVGRQVVSGGQKTIKISLMHEKAEAIMAAVAATSKELSRLKSAAEQWTAANRWLLLLVRLHRKYLGGKRPEGFPKEGELLLSG